MGEMCLMLSVLQSFECHQVGVIALQEKSYGKILLEATIL